MTSPGHYVLHFNYNVYSVKDKRCLKAHRERYLVVLLKISVNGLMFTYVECATNQDSEPLFRGRWMGTSKRLLIDELRRFTSV